MRGGPGCGDTREPSKFQKIVEPKGFKAAAENDSLALFVNGSTTEIAVLDKKTGALWYSNPPDQDERETLAREWPGIGYIHSWLSRIYSRRSTSIHDELRRFSCLRAVPHYTYC